MRVLAIERLLLTEFFHMFHFQLIVVYDAESVTDLVFRHKGSQFVQEFPKILTDCLFPDKVYLLAQASIFVPFIKIASPEISPISNRKFIISVVMATAPGAKCRGRKRAKVAWSGAADSSRRYIKL